MVGFAQRSADRSRGFAALLAISSAGCTAIDPAPSHPVGPTTGLATCDDAALAMTNIGCSFVAAVLPSKPDDGARYGIAFVNPGNETAWVEIDGPMGTHTLKVGPGDFKTWHVDAAANMLNWPGVTEADIPEVGRALCDQNCPTYHNRSFSIASDRPVAAYQLSPAREEATDASMLVPVHALGTEYVGLTHDGKGAWSATSFTAILATEDDTKITLRHVDQFASPSEKILNKGDAFLVFGDGANRDLTGLRVSATQKVAVLTGNRCVGVGESSEYCEHIEEQMLPTRALGMTIPVARTPTRETCGTSDRVRVVATQDATELFSDARRIGPWHLNAGEWIETSVADATNFHANAPVQVGRFFSGLGENCDGFGNPALTLQIPQNRYLSSYSFFAMESGHQKFVGVMVQKGELLELDGELASYVEQASIDEVWDWKVISVPGGSHTLVGEVPFGAYVYGYGSRPAHSPIPYASSFGYPAGAYLGSATEML